MQEYANTVYIRLRIVIYTVMLHYHNASTGAVNHCEANMWRIDAQSYKLVHVLMVHISHLSRTSKRNHCQSINLFVSGFQQNLNKNALSIPVRLFLKANVIYLCHFKDLYQRQTSYRLN